MSEQTQEKVIEWWREWDFDYTAMADQPLRELLDILKPVLAERDAGIDAGDEVVTLSAQVEMSESENKRLEEMAREWLTGRSVHGVTEGCTFLAGEINTSLADLSELLGQVRREERERGTVRLRYETAKFTQEEESRSVNARLLDEALLRLSEVGAERDAAFSGRQHEYLLRVEGERDEARAERDELRAEVERLKDRISRLGLQRGAQQIRAEKAEAALREIDAEAGCPAAEYVPALVRIWEIARAVLRAKAQP